MNNVLVFFALLGYFLAFAHATAWLVKSVIRWLREREPAPPGDVPPELWATRRSWPALPGEPGDDECVREVLGDERWKLALAYREARTSFGAESPQALAAKAACVGSGKLPVGYYSWYDDAAGVWRWHPMNTDATSSGPFGSVCDDDE